MARTMGTPLGLLALLAACGGIAAAQQWEAGAGVGASLYNRNTISSPQSSVDAKFTTGIALTAFLGQVGNRVGGELRYGWQWNEMELAGAGRAVARNGYSQTLAYHLLLYGAGRERKVRPYLLGGGGFKRYTGTGSASGTVPQDGVAVLRRGSEWKAAVDAGAGLRIAARRNAHLRLELLLTLTKPPARVIMPLAGSTSGWYVQAVPLLAFSYAW